MRITKYKITRIAEVEEDLVNQWNIQIDLVPTWVERVFTAKEPIRRAMVGSCLHWKWGDGSKVNYFWSVWANNVVKKRVKNKGALTYVNSSFDQPEDR